MAGGKKSEFELGIWQARQDLAKQLEAICLVNDPEQTHAKVKALAAKMAREK